MDEKTISALLTYIPAFLAFVSALLSAFFGFRSAKKLESIKKQTITETEHLKIELKHMEESELLKRKYTLPLLKAAEDLYNKLNDVVQNHEKVLPNFKSLSEEVANMNSVSQILSSPVKIYITSMIYLFARYFEAIEIIKIDVGFLKFDTDIETKALQLRIRQTTATFSSNRLHNNIHIREPNQLKYHGKILEGAQILIGEWMMQNRKEGRKLTSYYDFCECLVSDKNYQKMLTPIIDFLSDLQVTPNISSDSTEVDFRWAKIIYFTYFLKTLITEIDSARAVELLPELEMIKDQYWYINPILKENLTYFVRAYPNP